MVTKEHDAALLITTLPSVPGAQLTVAGQCASLTVKTNMETYVAEAWAEVDGQACDARAVADFDVSEGEIRVSVTEALARLTLAVPAAFEVSVGLGNGRSSWDEVTVLYAIFGTQMYSEDWGGGGSLPNGYSWSFTQSYPARAWADPLDDWQVEQEIERLMTLPPL